MIATIVHAGVQLIGIFFPLEVLSLDKNATLLLAGVGAILPELLEQMGRRPTRPATPDSEQE